MSRSRSNNRAEALKIWIKSSREKKLTDIAEELGISPALVRKWKFLDKWDEIPVKRKRGAQPGNKNSIGNSGGPGGPVGNDKAVIHGLFRKFMPQDPEFLELLDMAQQMEPLDMIWQTVEIAYTKMIWAQRIMFVRDKNDETKVLKKQKRQIDREMVGEGENASMESFDVFVEEEWEYQHAWDKQAVDIKTFAVAMREFRSAVKQFLSAAPENDERRAKLEMMNVQMEKAKTEHERVKLQVEKLANNGDELDDDSKLIDDWVNGVMQDE
ncbi:phage terminase small subunit [Paenibacillus sp. NRS-1760]|uniref:phage terminase small subunit n=1 Tax=Paenibacillus sp. NRS-1760 TaxID=3233902 RepID=UPI003D27CCC3